jgi:hypothetical protein
MPDTRDAGTPTQLAGPQRLDGVCATMRRAQALLGGSFFASLRASGLRLPKVEPLQPLVLSKRLRRYGQ